MITYRGGTLGAGALQSAAAGGASAAAQAIGTQVAGAQVAGAQVAGTQRATQSGATQAATQADAQTAAQGAAAGVPPGALATLGELLGRPATLADVELIRSRADALSQQLRSASSRRSEIVEELKRTDLDEAVREGLRQRLKVLDDRLSSLETEIARNSQLSAAIPPSLLAEVTVSVPTATGNVASRLPAEGVIAISIVFTIFVLMPIAVAYARRLWRRPVAPQSNPQLIAVNDRMARMEHAIDAVALEVERISEGQRFVTQTLGKRGDAAPLPIGEKRGESRLITTGEPLGEPRSLPSGGKEG